MTMFFRWQRVQVLVQPPACESQNERPPDWSGLWVRTQDSGEVKSGHSSALHDYRYSPCLRPTVLLSFRA